jgi:hypothetical protein
MEIFVLGKGKKPSNNIQKIVTLLAVPGQAAGL